MKGAPDGGRMYGRREPWERKYGTWLTSKAAEPGLCSTRPNTSGCWRNSRSWSLSEPMTPQRRRETRQSRLSRRPLPDEVYARVRDAIRELAANPRPPDGRKLTGREGWRIRVGDYRVIYEIDDTRHRITVLHVGHRRDVYR
ncbi:type II toxin-antitoxin system RelE family toxin [Carboxydichorda subterranea]|uniref:type II toxin-antitoxin system RelE family toxin n=1 Tax=Carboxydichorda subterranea TaxID=3109565 RepID=UPI0038577832